MCDVEHSISNYLDDLGVHITLVEDNQKFKYFAKKKSIVSKIIKSLVKEKFPP